MYAQKLELRQQKAQQKEAKSQMSQSIHGELDRKDREKETSQPLHLPFPRPKHQSK